MEIKFNVTGAKRKEFVEAVSQILGWEPVYKGAPTFAYAVENFIIDKSGTLTGDITQELITALAERGFVAAENAIGAEADIAATEQPGHESWSEAATPENAPLTPNVPSDDINAYLPTETGALAIELPLEGFTDTTLDNLKKLIESKSNLIKNALGVDALPVEHTETAVSFPWFSPSIEQDELNAYENFIVALCKMAKEQSRVTAKVKDVDNEKYAFRCFLLRLGFIGKDYGSVRKILLSRLHGNGSFKSGERRQTAPTEGAIAGENEDMSAAATMPAAESEAALAEELADAELLRAVNASFESDAESGELENE